MSHVDHSTSAGFQVFVKTLRGPSLALHVHPSQRVDDVKQMIQDKEGVFACQQRLTCEGKTLEDGHVLSDYAVLHAESVVELLLSVRGGHKKKGKCHEYGCGGKAVYVCSNCDEPICNYHSRRISYDGDFVAMLCIGCKYDLLY